MFLSRKYEQGSQIKTLAPLFLINMKTIEPVKIRVISLKRRNHIRKMTFSAFGKSITKVTRQHISDKFLLLCQEGMDDYTACKLVIFSYSGDLKSKRLIEQFIDQKNLEKGIMLKT